MNYHSVMNKSSTTTEQDGRMSRRRARTRAELLVAARQVFATHGYHDASIAQITAAADVGVGTFYLHFRDKDEVFSILLDEGFKELREQVTKALEQQSGEVTLTPVIRAIFQQAYAQRDLFQIALSDGGQFRRTFRAQARLVESLSLTLEAANARNLLTEYNVPLLARFITGIVTQGIVWWFEQDEPGPEAMTNQVVQLLRHGLPAQLLVDKE